ncbi:MAG: DUF2809 domain-containing protein [Clostridia bacterium]|nr:DUF2809 domain-containing protein [Clostridia bacterium]
MRPRLPYLIGAVVLLLVEILIGAFLHDAFIRPYGGDILVIPLLAAIWRIVFPKKPRHIGLYMIGAGFLAEFLQLIGFCRIMGLEGTIWAVILGTGFSVLDLLCYIVGGVGFEVVETNFFRGCRH